VLVYGESRVPAVEWRGQGGAQGGEGARVRGYLERITEWEGTYERSPCSPGMEPVKGG